MSETTERSKRIAEENDRKLVANYWAKQENWKTDEFKTFRAKAERLSQETNRCSVEELLEIARQGRAMTAEQALAVLIQDKIQEQKEKPHTDY